MKTIIHNEICCPKCKQSEFIESFAIDGCYICKHYIDKIDPCEDVAMCFCKKCNKFYPQHRFACIDKVYYCKECDKINWGLTEFWQDAIYYAMKQKHNKIPDL